MCFDYDEYAEVYCEEVRKARKAHRCRGCGKIIEQGTLYIYGSGVCDGSGFSEKSCGVCRVHQKRIEAIENDHGCRGDSAWCPLDDLGQWLYDNPTFELATFEEGQALLQTMRPVKQRGEEITTSRPQAQTENA